MVQTIRIEAAARERAGKGAARATRREGLVPGVIYGAKQEATLIALDPRDIMKELHKGGWQSHLFEVAVKDGPTERTLMRDVQLHPVTDRPVHIDFQRVAARRQAGRRRPMPSGGIRSLPMVIDPADRQSRPERHLVTSMTSIRIGIARAIARTLPTCPSCQRPTPRRNP